MKTSTKCGFKHHIAYLTMSLIRKVLKSLGTWNQLKWYPKVCYKILFLCFKVHRVFCIYFLISRSWFSSHKLRICKFVFSNSPLFVFFIIMYSFLPFNWFLPRLVLSLHSFFPCVFLPVLAPSISICGRRSLNLSAWKKKPEWKYTNRRAWSCVRMWVYIVCVHTHDCTISRFKSER